MRFLYRLAVGVYVLGFLGLTMPAVHADLILNGFGTVAWDRGAMPSGSQAITFAVTPNLDSNDVNTLNSFGIGLRIVPKSGATGTLSAGTPSKAIAESVFDTFSPALNITIPSPGVPTVNGNNFGAVDVTLTNRRNLFDLAFTSTDAAGGFDIYAVSEFTSYFPSTEFDGLKFANVTGPDVLLGTIKVSAVPEPSSAALLALAGIASVFWRKRCGLRGSVTLSK